MRLNADGELERVEGDGAVSVLCDAETLEPVLFADLPTEEAQEFVNDVRQRTPLEAPRPPVPTRRLTLDPERARAAAATRDGQGLSRSTMSPEQRERLEARDQRRNPSPSISPHPSASIADGQAFARDGLTPAQIKRLEDRDRKREA